MNRKLLIIMFVLIPLGFGQVCGQKIIRQSISSLSSGANLHGLYVNQTVGQPFSTVPSFDSKLFINPGFQQFLRRGERKQETPMDYTNLVVYPNPATSEIHVHSGIPESTYLKVTDMTGRMVYSNPEVPEQQFTINCSEWQSGFYIISVINLENQAVQTSKVLISK